MMHNPPRKVLHQPGARGSGLMRLVALLALLVSAAGCLAPEPDVGLLYRRATGNDDLEHHPVIVIPGILGSKLSSEELVVWGAFGSGAVDVETPDGLRLFAHPLGDTALAALTDAVQVDGVLDQLRLNLLGISISLNAYVSILNLLGVGGYKDESLGLSGALDYPDDHFTCFQFAYDWRRDNVENARSLHAFILAKTAFVKQKQIERFGVADDEVRFTIVAHSMGGLVARYYAMYGGEEPPENPEADTVPWAGAAHIDKLIVIGTPNAGSVQAVVEMVDGIQFAPFLPTFRPALIGTFPSVYQLLPRSRHGAVVWADDGEPVGDLLDPDLWEKLGWGLASPAQESVLAELLPELTPQERREAARAHLVKCLERARKFQAALDVPSAPPQSTRLYAFAGDAVQTASRVTVDRQTGAAEISETSPGDGTVLRSSVLLDERLDGDWTMRLRSPIAWSQVSFVFSDHLGMLRDPSFIDNALHILLEQGVAEPMDGKPSHEGHR